MVQPQHQQSPWPRRRSSVWLVALVLGLAVVLQAPSTRAFTVPPSALPLGRRHHTPPPRRVVTDTTSDNEKDVTAASFTSQPLLLTQLESLAHVTATEETAVATADALMMAHEQDKMLDAAVGNAWLEVHVYSCSVAVANDDKLTRIHAIVDRIAAPTDVSYGLVLEAYLRAKDWTGAERYWESLGVSQGDSNTMTTLLFHKRLRMFGLQGKPDQAEAYLRQQLLQPQPSSVVVDHKAWVHVLRAYASAVGRQPKVKKSRRRSSPRDNSNHDEEEEEESADDAYLAKIHALLEEMTQHGVKPTTDAYNALLRAMAHHSNLTDKSQKAESVLFGLLDQCKTDPTVRPNADSFYYTLVASRGQPYPKAESLWQLQRALWRQTGGDVTLAPAVRNLNAASAALAVSRLPNKAAKAQQWTTELQALAEELEVTTDILVSSSNNNANKMTPNLDSYKNILSAAAHTSRHAPLRERRQALEIALALRHELLVQQPSSSSSSSTQQQPPSLSARDTATIYKLLLQAVGHLLDTPAKRDALATELFVACCTAGVTTPAVVTALQRAASETAVLRILGGFAEDLLQLPAAWTVHVVE